MSREFESKHSGRQFATTQHFGAMGPEERWLSMAAGACLAGYGLSRLRLRALAALGVGAYLAYRGSIGRCPLSERLVARASRGGHERGRQFSGRDQPAPVEERSLRQVDSVDQAAMESFPASDSPSYTSAPAAPSVPIK